ncbi:MAG TPA: LLM class F420-dependent oxidoreductase [Chloroflexota bacterium]|jgi:probable F420-dependent oxidoreductase
MNLGRIGIWSSALRNAETSVAADASAELETLGYGALWFPGGSPEGFADHVSGLLGATKNVVIASGIVSVWTHDPKTISKQYQQFEAQAPGRFLLGIGISHPHVVERAGLTYQKPMARLRWFLDELENVPIERRILASLGPKSLQLARERSWGTHPYFVPVAHTRVARAAIGPGKLLAPELMVVLETDPAKARATARQHMAMYLGAPNYTNNLLRLGYTAEDIGGGGSDRIVDDIVAWGDEARILARVQEHIDAGADHVCVQVLNQDRRVPALDEWRRLATAFFARS